MSSNFKHFFLVTEAERNIKSSKDILTSLESNSYMRKESLKTWNDTLSGKLYELKNLILKAKLTADGVRQNLKYLTPLLIFNIF